MYRGIKSGENYEQGLSDHEDLPNAPERFGYSQSKTFNRANLKLCKNKFLSGENYKPAVIASEERIRKLNSNLKIVSNSSPICSPKDLEDRIEMTRKLRREGKI
jgi:hypothetical protein